MGRLGCFLVLLLLPFISVAGRFGVSGTYVIFGKEPLHLKGYQLVLDYDPECLCLGPFEVLFDGGFSHFWNRNKPCYRIVNAYSVAPILRYEFVNHPCNVQPYLDFSIGLTYLNHTHIEKRKLGIHFAFQDRIGLGFLFGSAKKLSVAIQAMHYSNAHLSCHNSGITAPVVLDIGYWFN